MSKISYPPCFVCGKPMKPEAPQGDINWPPSHGCTFESQGNYGSVVFDPEGNRRLRIVVCDDCLKAHPERARLVIPPMPVRIEPRVVAFELGKVDADL